MATGGSSIYKGSDLIHEYSCSKCVENDLNSEAKHFCPLCDHYLCNKCVKLHNGYHNKHTVYGHGDMQKWAGFYMDRCDQHGNKLEVHCDDHQELCCSVCVALTHRLCSSISHLPDLARGFLNTAEFMQLPAAVEKMRNRFDELKNAMLKDQISLKDSYENILSEIKALRNEMNMMLDKLEKKTVDKLDSMKKDLEKSIEADIETCAQKNDQLKNMMEKLQQMAGKHKETNSYIGFRKCQTMLNEATSITLEVKKRPTKRIDFVSDKSVLPFLRDLNSLGNVDSINSMTKRTYSDHVYETQGSTFHSVRIKKDIYKCYIVSICEFPSGEVVIADRRNSRVKLLNNLYQVTDYYDLPYYVQNLCLTAGDNMAVAVDDSLSSHITHEIHFLSVTRGKLQAVRKFTTNHNCRCIAHHQGQLYVSSNCALFQYTMDGTPVKKILEHISRGWPEHRCAVSTDGLRIYETYLSEKKLITLDKDGQVLSTLEDPELQEPCGLFVSQSGHVFCVWEEISHSVTSGQGG
ncbi:uncharacterized protein LOC128209120 [Mya arenaria]|uniref:uncharacterized protein LOC128209120 n=1 Tax=Mya arenaria TaxID=6604 RepID=UPI0022E59275|nr:uncharacterized protein LOC128209120 [Mya arenaria]